MSVATSYAKALFEAAETQTAIPAVLDTIEKELDQVIELLQGNKPLEMALCSSVTTMPEKVSIMEGLLEKLKPSELVHRFLILLAKKNRISFLKQVRDAWFTVRLSAEGGMAGQLVSVDPMSQEDMNALAIAFAKKFGRKIAFQVSTNPALLAGVKVTVNGVTYDGTLHSQLKKVRDRLLAGMPGAHA
jgi:F-type H+-transporting ATPase subunit delta